MAIDFFMNYPPPSEKHDLGPQQFATAVLLGGLGTAGLSYLHLPSQVSVLFALAVMITLAIVRFQAASQVRDAGYLEAFAEDVYLLGYLLTLTSLLGLVPRLMSDEASLFQIAGLKLVTTVFGLGMMMVFRQLARRWAAEKLNAEGGDFAAQQKAFSDSMVKFNQGADELTSKLNDVVRSFEPSSLAPLMEWPSRATDAFGGAAKAMEALPTAIDTCIQRLVCLGDDLQRSQTAAAEFSVTLTEGPAKSASLLSTEIDQASGAIGELNSSVSDLRTAGNAVKEALGTLGEHANDGVSKLESVADGLQRTDQQLLKFVSSLEQILDLHADNPKLPMNRLIAVLEVIAKGTGNSSEGLGQIQAGLTKMASSSQELIQHLERHAEQVILQQKQSFRLAEQQLTEIAGHFNDVKDQLGTTHAEELPDNLKESQLTAGLEHLRQDISETNEQIRALVARLDQAASPDSKLGIFRRFMGGSQQ